MSLDAFISYSSKDKPAADAACAVLESKGIRCWIAPRDIVAGADWAKSIVAAIDSCQLMVLIFSRHANQSPQVKREVERIVHRGLPVIPVRIEDVLPAEALEFFISLPHWLDAFPPPLEQYLTRLAADVNQLLGRPAENPTVSRARFVANGNVWPGGDERRPGQRWFAGAAALATAVVLGCLLMGMAYKVGWFVESKPPIAPPIPADQAKTPDAPVKGPTNVSRPTEGLEVRAVTPGSPAEKAGLRVGYVLVRIDGQPITSYASWVGALTEGHHTIVFWDDERRNLRETSIEKTRDLMGVSVSR